MLITTLGALIWLGKVWFEKFLEAPIKHVAHGVMGVIAVISIVPAIIMIIDAIKAVRKWKVAAKA